MNGLDGLRIAHLIESDGPGGAERVVAQLATGLQAAGAENVVFLPRRGEGWLAGQLRGSGVAIETFALDRPISAACSRSLTEGFRRHRITVAHSHEFSMAVYGAWSAWRDNIPHVITMHGGRYYAAELRRRLAMRAAIAISGTTVAVSAQLQRAMTEDLSLAKSKVQIIPNGVPRQRAESVTLRDELRLPPDARLIVSVGNLYPVKGHAHLVDAFARIAGRHPALHVAIAGRGDLEAELAARARALGLADRFHLLGLRADVRAILAAADIFAMPSVSEGLPLALLEAMFAGCPIVATNVGEIATVLDEGNAGVLVEPANPAALAAAIDALLNDAARAKQLGARAASRAAAEYDISRMVRRYATVYQELVQRRQPVWARQRQVTA
jgi:glycosyltransferase involved in cell wall biosynthesis